MRAFALSVGRLLECGVAFDIEVLLKERHVLEELARRLKGLELDLVGFNSFVSLEVPNVLHNLN